MSDMTEILAPEPPPEERLFVTKVVIAVERTPKRICRSCRRRRILFRQTVSVDGGLKILGTEPVCAVCAGIRP